MARAEVTGRKPRATQDRPKRKTRRRDFESSTRQRPPSHGPPLALSIAEFCRAHSISERMYFKLRAQGLGPVEMAVGTRRLISLEAAEQWRREREASAA